MNSPSRFSEKEKSRILMVVFFTVFLDLIGYGLVFPMMPLLVTRLGGDSQTFGWIVSGYAAMQLLVTPLLGKLSDRYGRRSIILLSLVGNAASMVVFALADQVWMILVSRLIAGATAGNLAACQAVIADVTDRDERARGMGRMGAGIGLGLVMGPVLGSLLTELGSWAPPIAAAVAALIDLTLAWMWMPETRRPAQDAPGVDAAGATLAKPSVWTALSEPRLLAVMSLTFLTFYCLSNLQVALALLSHERLGWTEREVGYAFGLFGGVTMLVQGVLLGRLVRHFGEINLVLTGAICIGAGMWVIAGAYSDLRLVLGCLLFAWGVAMSNPSLASLASRFTRSDQQGVILGLNQSSGGLARTVGPSLGGWLFARFGAGSPFSVGVGVALVSLTLSIWLRTRDARMGQSG